MSTRSRSWSFKDKCVPKEDLRNENGEVDSAAVEARLHRRGVLGSSRGHQIHSRRSDAEGQVETGQ